MAATALARAEIPQPLTSLAKLRFKVSLAWPWSVCRGLTSQKPGGNRNRYFFVGATPTSILTSAMAVLSRFYGSWTTVNGVIEG